MIPAIMMPFWITPSTLTSGCDASHLTVSDLAVAFVHLPQIVPDDLQTRAGLDVGHGRVLERLLDRVARDPAHHQDVALLDETRNACGRRRVVLRPDVDRVLRLGDDVVQDHDGHARLACCVDGRSERRPCERQEQDPVDAVADHLLDRRDLLLRRRGRVARLDVLLQRPGHEALGLRLVELDADLLDDVREPRRTDRERDQTDLPGLLDALERRPRGSP